MDVGSTVSDEQWRCTMWPWTLEENQYLTKFFTPGLDENKKTVDALSHKMKKIALDVTDIQIDMATKMFGLVNKHTDNFFGLYENVFNKQVLNYRNVVHSMYKE